VARLAFYVDGFNVFHAVDGNCPEFLWLNYRQLAQQFLNPGDILELVVYFSAYAQWNLDDWQRHREYVAALQSVGIEIVLGKFKETHPKCRLCHREYLSHTEKQTDVNIALRVVQDAILGLYDRAIIASADGDLVPIWRTLGRLNLPQRVGILMPIGTQHTTLEQACHFTLYMHKSHLRKAQFPDEHPAPGRSPIKKPAEWIADRMQVFQRKMAAAARQQRL
jgi:uncharacterized LabA/DUF88 family protein